MKRQTWVTTHPEVLDIWDYEKNEKQPCEYSTDDTVWWVCKSCGESYSAKIFKILYSQSKHYPICKGAAYKERGSGGKLSETRPDIAAEWDYERNELTPDQVSLYSGKKVYWLCSRGHSYESCISDRIQKGTKCPYCSGRRCLAGFNDLQTAFPDVVNEWDYEKNAFTPDSVTSGSNKKAWWICPRGHNYYASIKERFRSHKTGCPICGKNKVDSGVNDLVSSHPELLEFWDYEKNGILPSQVSFGADTKVFWKCKEGHSYITSVDTKARIANQACPICDKKRKKNVASE